jgi:hypothetical protein
MYLLNVSSNDANKRWHGKYTEGQEKMKDSQQLFSFMDIKRRGRVAITPVLYSDNIKVDLKNNE